VTATAQALTKSQARWVLAVTILASSVAFIDMTIVNLALPVMQIEMGSSFRSMQWVVEAYVLFLTALMLTGGGLADAFGRRRMLCIGAAVFGVASVCAGLAQTSEQLIVSRALQGTGGALLAPASLAIVSSSFPPGERGKALGLWAAFSGISTAIAPPLGGLLLEVWSWRAVFFVNVPVVLIVLLIAPWQVPESFDDERGSGIDWAGSVTAIGALGLFTYALLRAGEAGISDPLVLGCLIGSVFSTIGFVMIEKAVRAPMLPLELFASRRFSGLNAMTLALFTAVGSVMFFLPMTLMQAYHYSPLEAGAATMPSMFVMFVMAPQVGKWVDRHGPALPLIAGPLVSALAYVVFASVDNPDYLSGVLVPVMLMGCGFGAWVTPLTSSVMSAAGDDRAGIASGVNNAVARMAQLFAIAVLGLLAANAFNAALDVELVKLAMPEHLVAALAEERIKMGAMTAPDGFPVEYVAPLESAVAQSFRNAFGTVAWAASGLCVVASALGAWSLKRPS
jgi:EmrB/QacA subfamily drug resistance transporter